MRTTGGSHERYSKNGAARQRDAGTAVGRSAHPIQPGGCPGAARRRRTRRTVQGWVFRSLVLRRGIQLLGACEPRRPVERWVFRSLVLRRRVPLLGARDPRIFRWRICAALFRTGLFARLCRPLSRREQLLRKSRVLGSLREGLLRRRILP